MKNKFLQLFMISILLFSCEVIAQIDEYEQAISLLKEQLNNPDLTTEMRSALRDALAETQEQLKEIKSTDNQDFIYSGDEPKSNYESKESNERRNNLQGLVSPSSSAPLTPRGMPMTSGNAN